METFEEMQRVKNKRDAAHGEALKEMMMNINYGMSQAEASKIYYLKVSEINKIYVEDYNIIILTNRISRGFYL